MNVTEFENFIIKYEKDIFHFCRHLTMSQELAEDLYQDTILKAFEMKLIRSKRNLFTLFVSKFLFIFRTKSFYKLLC